MVEAQVVVSDGHNSSSLIRTSKILAIVAYTLILISIILLNQNPSDGTYEFSIYSSLPLAFWAQLIISIIIGFILISITIKHPSRISAFLGFSIVLLSNTVLLLLPILKKYLIYGRGDVLTHIGWMNTIIDTGSIQNLHYPIDHILGVSVTYVAGINTFTVVSIIPFIFSILFIVSILVLSRLVLRSKKQVMLAIMLGSIMLFGYNYHLLFAPSHEIFFLLPLSLFIFIKSYSSDFHPRYKILFLLIIISTVLFHPMNSIILIFIIVCFGIINFFLRRRGTDSRALSNGLNKGYLKTVIVIFMIAYLSWQSYVILIKGQVRSIIQSFEEGFTDSQLSNYSDIISSHNLSFIDVWDYLLLTYGQIIFLVLPVGIGIIYHLVRLRKKNNEMHPILLTFALAFLLLSIISAVELIFTFVIESGRYLQYCIFFSILLLPALLLPNGDSNSIKVRRHNASLGKQNRLLHPSPSNIIISSLLVILLIISIASLYASPMVRLSNYQVTESEMTGMDHFFQRCDSSVEIYELGLSQFRFFDALYGQHMEHIGVSWGYPTPPDHFGYESATSWTGNITYPKYLLINEIGRYSYPNIFPDFYEEWRFYDSDFIRLSFDDNVSNVYSNGNLDVYLTGL